MAAFDLNYLRCNDNIALFNKAIVLSNISEKRIYPKNEDDLIKTYAYLGYSSYGNVDTLKYMNKTIEFIVNDLSTTHHLIGYDFPSKHDCSSENSQNDFEIYFKLSEGKALKISGILTRSTELSEDFSIAYNELLKQNRYRITFIQIDLYKYFNAQCKNIANGFNECNNYEFDVFEKNYPDVFKY